MSCMTQADITVASTDTKDLLTSVGRCSAGGMIVVGIMGAIIAILLSVAIVLLVVVLIQRRHVYRKQYTVESDDGHYVPNPVYDG